MRWSAPSGDAAGQGQRDPAGVAPVSGDRGPVALLGLLLCHHHLHPHLPRHPALQQAGQVLLSTDWLYSSTVGVTMYIPALQQAGKVLLSTDWLYTSTQQQGSLCTFLPYSTTRGESSSEHWPYTNTEQQGSLCMLLLQQVGGKFFWALTDCTLAHGAAAKEVTVYVPALQQAGQVLLSTDRLYSSTEQQGSLCTFLPYNKREKYFWALTAEEVTAYVPALQQAGKVLQQEGHCVQYCPQLLQHQWKFYWTEHWLCNCMQ